MNKYYYLSEYVFFRLEPEVILLWDCYHNQQFILEELYFEALKALPNVLENTPAVVYQDLLDNGIISEQKPTTDTWGWDDLSKLYHVGTQNSQIIPAVSEASHVQSYLEECANLNGNIPSPFIEREGPIIDLPEVDLHAFDDQGFTSILQRRRTVREFSGDTISLQTLSNILYHSFGVQQQAMDVFDKLGLQSSGLRKVSPSGGGMHPEEAYLTIFHVDDLKAGLYHYRPQDHRLTLIEQGDLESKVFHINTNQQYSKGAAFGVYITAYFYRTWWKYHHSRAYRVVLLDLGHVSQTLQLVMTAAGLSTWITAALDDNQVNQLLDLNIKESSAFLYVAGGHSDGSPIPKEIAKQLKSS